MIQAIKKAYPILDEKGRPCTFPTFASQVYMEDGTSVESAIQNIGLNNDSNIQDGSCKVPSTDDIYPVGSILVTSSADISPGNNIPETTWELIDKRFKSRMTDDFFTASDSVVGAQFATISGNSIFFRVTLKPKSALADTSVALGSLDFTKLGLHDIYLTHYFCGISDGSNSISLATIEPNGTLNHIDDIGGELSTENNIMYSTTIVVSHTKMQDSACDQFIWKRVE